jgi:hypothetical protein
LTRPITGGEYTIYVSYIYRQCIVQRIFIVATLQCQSYTTLSVEMKTCN